jgi:hypothetical protein
MGTNISFFIFFISICIPQQLPKQGKTRLAICFEKQIFVTENLKRNRRGEGGEGYSTGQGVEPGCGVEQGVVYSRLHRTSYSISYLKVRGEGA